MIKKPIGIKYPKIPNSSEDRTGIREQRGRSRLVSREGGRDKTRKPITFRPRPTDDLPPVSTPDPIKPEQKLERKEITEHTVTHNANNRVIPVIYGKQKIGGLVIYRKALAQIRPLMVYLIGYGPINSISNIKIGGKTLAELSLVLNTDYEIHLGTASQSISAIMDAWEPNWVSALPGLAYVVIKFKAANETIPFVDPYQFECVVEGLLVYDPRTDPTLTTRYYRNNLCLCAADYLSSERYGAKIDYSKLKSINTTADDFDTGGWKLNLALTDKAELKSQINLIRSAGPLRLVKDADDIHLLMNKAQAASGVIFSDADGVDNIISAGWRWKGSSEVPSHVITNFIDESNDWQEDFVEVEHPDIVLLGKERVTHELDGRGITNFNQAKNFNILYYNAKQPDKEYFLVVGSEALRVLPSTRVTVTSNSLNLANQAMLVEDIEPLSDGIAWRLTLSLYDENIYSTDVYSRVIPPRPIPVSELYEVPPPVHNISSAGGDLYYWETPKKLYNLDATFTNISGFTVFDGGDLKDGDLETTAATGTNFVFEADLGSAQTIKEIFLYFNQSHADIDAFTTFSVEYWDGDSWEPVAITHWVNLFPEPYKVLRIRTTGLTSAQLWRVSKSSGTTINLFEIEIKFQNTYEYLPVKGYRVYDYQDKLIREINFQPTASNPVELPAHIKNEVYDEFGNLVSATFTSPYRIRVVNEINLVSPLYDAKFFDSLVTYISSYDGYEHVTLPQQEIQVTFSNGGNYNTAILRDGRYSSYYVSGPTADFELRGIEHYQPGRRIVIYNVVAYNFTLKHEYTSGTTAAARIKCLTGADEIVPPGHFVELYYSDSDDRWIVYYNSARNKAIPVAYSAGNFISDVGTWTVAAGDVAEYCYSIDGKKVDISVDIDNTDIASNPAVLGIAIPSGKTSSRIANFNVWVKDNNIWAPGVCLVGVGSAHLLFFRSMAAPVWTNGTGVAGMKATVSLWIN